MNYSSLLLSKVVENNDVDVLKRFNINEVDFHTKVEKKAYNFIAEYSKENNGHAPSYQELLINVEDFNFEPNIESSYDYLVRNIKDHTAKVLAVQTISNEASEQFDKLSGTEFLDWVSNEMTRIKEVINYQQVFGTNIKNDANKITDEYKNRKEGKMNRTFKSSFDTLNKTMGGYISGDYYVYYAKSGRGKSITTMAEVVNIAMNYDVNILVWSLEVSAFNWLARAFSYLSARHNFTTVTVDGERFEGGFTVSDIMFGKMSKEFEEAFFDFVNNMDKYLKGNIIVRGVNDKDFIRRDLAQLESDIIQTKASVVLVDPIYLMTPEKNVSRTAGGEMANTSIKIRSMCGRLDVVIIAITQASEDSKDVSEEDGTRGISIPTRGDMKKSKALLEDSAYSFGFDSVDGRGVLEIVKGRNGFEGTQVEIVFLPSYGIVQEAKYSSMADMFEV